MTIQSLRQQPDRLTIRYLPLLTWLFVGLAGYGVSRILLAVAQGSETLDSGVITALILLSGLVVFVAWIGGDVVIADFDRGQNRMLVRSFGLRGARRTERPLQEIVGLNVQVLRRNQHRVEVQLQSGERILLTSHYIVTIGLRGIHHLADFLAIDPQIIQSPTGRWIR